MNEHKNAADAYRRAQAAALIRAWNAGVEPLSDDRGKVIPSAEDLRAASAEWHAIVSPLN